MRKAYTWPNDPQVFGDAPLYRIVFAPGGTNVPITPSVGQASGVSTESVVPRCSALPGNYGYDSQYSGPGSTMCNRPCDVPVKLLCLGLSRQPPVLPSPTLAQPPPHHGPVISTRKAGGGDGRNNGVICRWQ